MPHSPQQPLIRTRFAPSPTGYLHIGHAYSALFTAAQGDEFILRIEDIDQTRARPEFYEAIYEDLTWLGLTWPAPVLIQSENMDAYADALDKLTSMGVLYPCNCTRKDINSQIDAPHFTASQGPEGMIYPGTCRHKTLDDMAEGQDYALRLNIDKALKHITAPLYFKDKDAGQVSVNPHLLGDVVLARKETPASYHLSVCVDDHAQGINLVTRGEDLLYACHIHRLIQALLGLDQPVYHHHKLLLDHEGKRFAKRNKSVTLQTIRANGFSLADLKQMIENNDYLDKLKDLI
jgi:glutamyl-Q tRNA(Asp) synthetase